MPCCAIAWWSCGCTGTLYQQLPTAPHRYFRLSDVYNSLTTLCLLILAAEARKSSTVKSAMTLAGNVFLPNDLDLWPFDPKINGFPALMVDHVYIQFGNSAAASVLRYRAEKTKRKTQSPVNTVSTHADGSHEGKNQRFHVADEWPLQKSDVGEFCWRVIMHSTGIAVFTSERAKRRSTIQCISAVNRDLDLIRTSTTQWNWIQSLVDSINFFFTPLPVRRSGNGIVRIIEVILGRARLVLGVLTSDVKDSFFGLKTSLPLQGQTGLKAKNLTSVSASSTWSRPQGTLASALRFWPRPRIKI